MKSLQYIHINVILRVKVPEYFYGVPLNLNIPQFGKIFRPLINQLFKVLILRLMRRWYNCLDSLQQHQTLLSSPLTFLACSGYASSFDKPKNFLAANSSDDILMYPWLITWKNPVVASIAYLSH